MEAAGTINKRYLELDVARGLAIVFMILIHVMEYLPSESVINSLPGEIIAFLGTVPSAPVFMLIMGAGVVLSRRNTPMSLLKRGLLIFSTGYLLNLLRGSLPALLGWLFTGEALYRGYVLETLFSVDILQFAGLALMAMALIRRLKLGSRQLIALAISLGLAATFQPSGGDQQLPWAALSSLFIGSSLDISYFPFLNWFIYPLAGYIFATSLTKADDRTAFYRKLLIGSAAAFLLINAASLFLAGATGTSYIIIDYQGNYLHHDFQHALSYVAFTLVWISTLHFASKKTPALVMKPLERWSRNVLEIYFLQWLLVVYTGIAIGFHSLNLVGYIAASAGILALADALASLYSRRWKQGPS